MRMLRRTISGNISPLDVRRVNLDGKADALVHRDSQWLRATHATKSGGECHGVLERAAVVLARRLGKRFVRSLDDTLGADINPRASGHLAIHG
jgi:hypothetical protein